MMHVFLYEIYPKFDSVIIFFQKVMKISMSFFLINNLHSNFDYTLLSPSKNSANFSYFFRNKSIKLVYTADLFVVLCMHIQLYFTLLLIYCLLAVLFVGMYRLKSLANIIIRRTVLDCLYNYRTAPCLKVRIVKLHMLNLDCLGMFVDRKENLWEIDIPRGKSWTM